MIWSCDWLKRRFEIWFESLDFLEMQFNPSRIWFSSISHVLLPFSLSKNPPGDNMDMRTQRTDLSWQSEQGLSQTIWFHGLKQAARWTVTANQESRGQSQRVFSMNSSAGGEVAWRHMVINLEMKTPLEAFHSSWRRKHVNQQNLVLI